ncbi:HPF/RaiA family ribosome-associated protein [Thermomonas sp.]|uniref:HPF/RaiA family ribosome-associated protein n=1 Tax=Thermomonas sp. TaxID=1971895 RepID=UPI00248A271E|nr:HPF/RaiA family ribosome-associated protein [Thermomonas sp.]MDI1253305.1 HPF/RaiA family ribosome-associated protein [Thermomonas sp.]
MQIQVNTDDHIEGHEALVARVEVAVASSLDRFSTHITRVEMHLSEENGDKSGENDKRCMMEARLEGRQPIAVTSHAATLDQAVASATNKLKRSLDDTLEQLLGHQS